SRCMYADIADNNQQFNCLAMMGKVCSSSKATGCNYPTYSLNNAVVNLMCPLYRLQGRTTNCPTSISLQTEWESCWMKLITTCSVISISKVQPSSALLPKAC